MNDIAPAALSEPEGDPFMLAAEAPPPAPQAFPEPLAVVRVPAASARAFTVKAGQFIQVVDVDGPPVFRPAGLRRRGICEISNELRLPFVKTSTGFFGDPVREDTVRLLRRHLDPSIQIKASGGISTYNQATKMIRAGADRQGCSQSVAIV